MSWRKYLLVPKLIWSSRRASRNQQVAWDRFWASVRRTGPGGDVLWDAGSEYEIEDTVRRLRPHLDPSLSIVDAGCGNGRYTRALAAYFPRAVGIDVSPHAIERAREESKDVESVSFRVEDVGLPQVGRKLAAEFGDANIYVRGGAFCNSCGN
jgi:SAM-dependent methyltransferase